MIHLSNVHDLQFARVASRHVLPPPYVAAQSIFNFVTCSNYVQFNTDLGYIIVEARNGSISNHSICARSALSYRTTTTGSAIS